MGKDMDTKIQQRLTNHKRTWSIVFKYCGPIFCREWILKHNGKTKNGETLNLTINGDKFDSGEANTSNYVPLWFLWESVNQGKRKKYYRHGLAYVPSLVRIKTVGANNDIQWSGSYEVETKTSWKQI